MKPLFFLLLIQLLAITLHCNATEPVYDTEGNQLDSNHNYYILPAKHVSGGGLKAIPTGLRCLNFVVQESSASLLGTTLQFTSLPPNTSAMIRLSSNIWIEFHDLESFCSDRLDWHITEHPPELSGRLKHVAAGNEDGVRSFGVFRIERHVTDVTGYKIMACAAKGACKDLGLHVYKDKTWLTISEEPFMVVFRKK